MKTSMSKRAAAILALVFASLTILFCAPGTGTDGASENATITGIIIDQGKAIIPGSTITVTVSGSQREVTSDSEGRYRIEGVATGLVFICAEKAGYKKFAYARVPIRAGRVKRIDFIMEVGQSTQVITVTTGVVSIVKDIEVPSPDPSKEVRKEFCDIELYKALLALSRFWPANAGDVGGIELLVHQCSHSQFRTLSATGRLPTATCSAGRTLRMAPAPNRRTRRERGRS